MANPALQYAAALRQSLIQDLFQGDEHVLEGQDIETNVTVEDIVGDDEFSLQDVDKDLEAFQDHELFKGILEQGRVLKEYAQDVDDKLRQTELDSLQVRRAMLRACLEFCQCVAIGSQAHNLRLASQVSARTHGTLVKMVIWP